MKMTLMKTKSRLKVNEALAKRLIETANAVLEGEHIVHNPGSIFGQLAKPELTIPREIFLLPVKERPFFPGQQLPVLLNKESWGKTYEAIKENKCKYIGIIFVNTEHHDKAEPSDFCKMGTLIKIHDPKVKEDYIQLIAEGIQRFEIKEWVSGKAPYRALVNYPKDIIDGSDQEYKAYGLAIMNAFRELLPLNPLYSEELKYFFKPL